MVFNKNEKKLFGIAGITACLVSTHRYRNTRSLFKAFESGGFVFSITGMFLWFSLRKKHLEYQELSLKEKEE